MASGVSKRYYQPTTLATSEEEDRHGAPRVRESIGPSGRPDERRPADGGGRDQTDHGHQEAHRKCRWQQHLLRHDGAGRRHHLDVLPRRGGRLVVDVLLDEPRQRRGGGGHRRPHRRGGAGSARAGAPATRRHQARPGRSQVPAVPRVRRGLHPLGPEVRPDLPALPPGERRPRAGRQRLTAFVPPRPPLSGARRGGGKKKTTTAPPEPPATACRPSSPRVPVSGGRGGTGQNKNHLRHSLFLYLA